LVLIPTVIAVTLQAADQVIGRVIVEVFLLGSRQLRGLALGTQDFAVQAVAFEIADHLAVEVDLVQVAAAVV
jgi:hypothetical protein